MADRVDKVRDYLLQVRGDLTGAGGLESLRDDGLESLLGVEDPQERDMALEGLRKLEAGSGAEEVELSALEAIILPKYRPVINIVRDGYQQISGLWKRLNESAIRARIGAAIPSVGCVEVPDHPSMPYAGTGFVVGPGLLMTNRHVAETFCGGTGFTNLVFHSLYGPSVDFKREVEYTEPDYLEIVGVKMIHAWWDAAILEVKGLSSDRAPLTLQGHALDNLKDREVVVIGYPARDRRSNWDVQNRIFGNLFEIKRLQPGKLTGYGDVHSFGHRVSALTHDSSTLGGNSGSAVLDLETGRVVGLHFAGRYLESNYAVPTWELARDPRVVDLVGEGFVDVRAVGDPPIWAAIRPRRPDTALAMEQSEDSALATPPSSLLGGDWYEHVNDALLKSALERDRESVQAHLVKLLGEEEAREVVSDLLGEQTEGLFIPEPDRSLPEIVYLHGIMGGHLANLAGVGDRIWFDPFELVKGNLAKKLRLDDDGQTDAAEGMVLDASGMLRIKYAKAARRWRRKGYVVHEFSYDWRKSIDQAADKLHAFLQQLFTLRPARRVVLVAHSMGGVVSAIYASRHPSWADRIEQAVVVGSPLGGSYAPMEAVLGTYPFFKTLSALSVGDELLDLQDTAITLPGLLEMLPHPKIFPHNPGDLYAQETWPTDPRPAQRWLTRSRHIKQEILSSPLLARTVGIVCNQYGTVDNAIVNEEGMLAPGPREGAGDGTVPICASAVEELRGRLYLARGKRHDDMMRHGDVIEAVDELLRKGAIEALPSFEPPVPGEAGKAEELPVEEGLESVGPVGVDVWQRFERGEMTADDIDWLLDPVRGRT